MKAPGVIQRLIDQVMKPFPLVRLYLENIIVFSESLDDYLDQLASFLQRVSGWKLEISIWKCCFEQ